MTATKKQPHEFSEAFDIHDYEFVKNPYPVYKKMREACPVLHTTKYDGFWLTTHYEDVKNVALDWKTYTSSVPGRNAIPIITRRTEPLLPIEVDPPKHSRYRALVNPVFSAKRTEELGPQVRAIASELVEALISQGSGDLVADYCVPLSVTTLAVFTGFPVEDAPLWVSWITRMFNPHDPQDSAKASGLFGEYVDAMIRERRQQPRGDVISLLFDSEVEGQRLTDQEIHAFCRVVFGAGFETTADSMSVMLHYLGQNRHAYEQLRQNSELIPTAVEEFLRVSTPIQIFGRTATKDHELRGKKVQQGDLVAMGFAAANHDPSVFSEPERCILDRTPNQHLTFGAGVHLCLGAPVARLEMRVTLETFLERVARFELGDDATWKSRGDRRGFAKLLVRNVLEKGVL
jgi:cytochrome P450